MPPRGRNAANADIAAAAGGPPDDDHTFCIRKCVCEAIAALQRLQELFPGGRQALLLLARALADNGALEPARQSLELARRPVESGQQLTPREALARAQAKVTFLRSTARPSPEADNA